MMKTVHVHPKHHVFQSANTLIGCLLLAILFLAAVSTDAQASENGNLPGLINERLSYMKDVASSKAVNHQPVEVLD